MSEQRNDESGYNGWSNYETWAMALWIDNDRGSYNWARELAENAQQTARDDHESYRTASGLLADELQAWQDELMPELEASVWSDLLGGAFSSVDWYEIADGILSEMDEMPQMVGDQIMHEVRHHVVGERSEQPNATTRNWKD